MLESTVVFNEVMYNPPGETDETLEWVELYNQMAVDMDLSGWRIDGGIDFDFPNETVVPGGGYLVVAADPVALEAATGFDEAMGPFFGRLDNGGERIDLVSNSDQLMDSLDYNDSQPWPVAPDGSGTTLVKAEPDTGTAAPQNWTWSRHLGGTPGSDVPFTDEGTVTISTVGDGTGYDDTTPAYLSTDVPKSFDVDGDNAYGTAGRLMFGLSGGGQASQQPFSAHINMLPSWVTSATAGTDFATVAYAFAHYTSIDDPTLFPGPSVPDWDSRSGLATGGALDNGFESILDFTIGAGTPQQFRVGVMAGNEGTDDGRWDPIGIRLTGPGDSASVTELPITEPGLGWVFFDVDIGDATGGTFTVAAQQRIDGTAGPSIGGITFDTPGGGNVVAISTVGDGTGYDDTTPAYLSTDVPKSFDVVGVDADDAYGTAGRFMFGRSSGTAANGQPFGAHIDMLPAWVTSATQGTDFTSVAYAFSSYPVIDDPELSPGPSVPDWVGRSGLGLSTAGGTGFESILNFTIGQGAPQQFRVGVLAGTEGNADGRWDPIGVRLAGPNGSATVTSLPITSLGWVFFDVDVGDATSGSFTVSAQQRLTSQGPSIGGITFDSITEPRDPGDPVDPDEDAPPALAINELAGSNDTNFRVEIVNLGDEAVELENLVLDCSADAAPDYVFPAHTLDPGAFLVLDEATLGVSLGDGDRLFLFDRDKTAVIDAARVDDSPRGRLPEGTGRWLIPDVATFGAANSFDLRDEIVINEIHYHAYPDRGTPATPGTPPTYETRVLVD